MSINCAENENELLSEGVYIEDGDWTSTVNRKRCESFNFWPLHVQLSERCSKLLNALVNRDAALETNELKHLSPETNWGCD
jgi:hypothetical protein